MFDTQKKRTQPHTKYAVINHLETNFASRHHILIFPFFETTWLSEHSESDIWEVVSVKVKFRISSVANPFWHVETTILKHNLRKTTDWFESETNNNCISSAKDNDVYVNISSNRCTVFLCAVHLQIFKLHIYWNFHYSQSHTQSSFWTEFLSNQMETMHQLFLI